MGYFEFNIKIPPDSSDALIQKLSDIGCLGIIISEQSIVVYFPDEVYVDKVKNELEAFKTILSDAGLPNSLSYEYTYISEKDWNEEWKRNFQPIEVGERLSIIPPWKEAIPNRINIIIDPGMAFGTGHHETTIRCLLEIERFSKNMTKKSRFLDIGTGTGILAIAAAMLGFDYVVGLDIDPLAIEAAKRNVELNKLKNVDIKCEGLKDVKQSFDLIVANLIANTLIKLASEIVYHLDKEGITIFSGIIKGQEDDVMKEYEGFNMQFIEKIIDGKWITLIAKKHLKEEG